MSIVMFPLKDVFVAAGAKLISPPSSPPTADKVGVVRVLLVRV